MHSRFLSAARLVPLTLLISPVALAHPSTVHSNGLEFGFMHPLAGYITGLVLAAGLLLKLGAVLYNAVTGGKSFSKAGS